MNDELSINELDAVSGGAQVDTSSSWMAWTVNHLTISTRLKFSCNPSGSPGRSPDPGHATL
jgi:bacteriocin-like protein